MYGGTDGTRGGALIVGLLLLTVPLTGCMGYGSDEDPYSATWQSKPEDAQAGETIEMSWEIDGPPGEAEETRVFYGQESSGDPRTEADYEDSAGRVSPAEVPGTYDADVTINQPGTYYFSARVLAEDGQAVWTEEVEVQIAAGDEAQTPINVEMGQSPSQAEAGERVDVNWSLSGAPGEIDQTSFHWGDSSVQDPSTDDYETQEGLTKPAEVPGEYNTTFEVEEPGTIYGRARAFDDGNAYWSDEVEIEIQSGNGTGGNETGNQTPENLVEIHDEGAAGVTTSTEFQPENITVTAGESVTWTNRGNGTHSVDFQDESLNDSDPIEPGQNFTWEVPEDLEPGDYEYEDGEATTSPATGSVEVQAPE